MIITIIALIVVAFAFAYNRQRRPVTYATVVPTMTVPKPDRPHAKPPMAEGKR